MNNSETLAKKFHDHFSKDPDTCVSMGIDKNLDQLKDPSLAHIDTWMQDSKSLLSEFESLDLEQLSFDEKIDAELAKLHLKKAIFVSELEFDGARQLEKMPKAADEITGGMFLLFANDPRAPKDRLSDITGRMKQVPEYLEKLKNRIKSPVTRWVDIDLQSIEGAPDFFQNLYDWSKSEDMDRELGAAIEEALPAIENYQVFLKSLKAEKKTSDQFSIGHEKAQKIVELRGIDRTLDSLHKMSREFLSETAETIEELREKLCTKYSFDKNMSAEDLHKALKAKYKIGGQETTPETVLARYQEEREKILSFIRERDLFPVLEDQNMKIIKTPDFMEPSIPAGAMMSPAPFRDGTKTSMVYLTLKPELIDEHSEIDIPNMMIHEGIPGHHLHHASASLNPSIIRKYCHANEQSEGWTTMLEDYMLDVGYMGDLTDEARFFGKRDINRIGARVAIDLYFMTGDIDFLDVGLDIDYKSQDPFENAGLLLQKVTGFTAGRTQAELNWYSQERGYPLCYLTGNRLVWEMKREMQDKHRGMEPIDIDRKFHKAYFEVGQMPVSFMRKVFTHQGLI